MVAKASVGEMEYALASLTGSLGFLTRVVFIQINNRARAEGALTLSPATIALLRLVQANPGIRQVDAAKILLIQESNMANLIKEIVAKGLIERKSAGGRRGGLFVTDEGEKHVQMNTWGDAINRDVASVLSDKEYQQLVQLLNRVYRSQLA
jgi:DNA-binding MarR family transcriptional regulator